MRSRLTAISLTFAALAATALAGAPAAVLAAEPVVAAITVEGNVRVDQSSIEGALPWRIGEPWDPSLLTKGVKSLYATGAFSRVGIEDEQADGGILVRVTVQEYPMVRSVVIEGSAAVPEQDLKKNLKMKAFGFYNPADVPADLQSIRKAFREAGYYTARVEMAKEDTDRGVRLLYKVEEGNKTLIREIDILGNRQIEDSRVLKVLQTSEMGPMSWLSESGVLKQDLLKDDMTRVGLLYMEEGFLDARVLDPEVRVHPEGDGLYVAVTVQEGPRYRVGKIRYTGDWSERPSFLRSDLKVKEGDVFRRSAFLEDLRMLEDSWRDQGYAWARIEPLVQRDSSANTVAFDLKLSRGDPVRIRRIDITGNYKTRDYVIRREMRIMEGDLYSQKKIDDSRRYVRALGFFNTVAIDMSDAGGGMADLKVTVEEGSSGTLTAGFAYSSVDGLVGTLSLSQANLFGRGQKLTLSGEFGGERSTYSIGFTEPRVFSGLFSLGVDLFETTREYSTYSQDSSGGGIRVGYRLSDTSSLNLRYRYADYNVYDLGPDASSFVEKQAGQSTTSSLRLGYTYDTRDFPMDPRNGTVLSVTSEIAGGILGGTNDFVRNTVEGSYFHPLYGDLIGSVHAEVGSIKAFEGDEVPVTERFFMGGLYTVRGFRYRMVGPLEDGEPIGGTKSFLVNLEASYPLVRDANIKGVLFVDTGSVWEEGAEVSAGDLRTGAGFGFRWASPMGLLRLEWGFNMDPRPDEDQPGWEFSIGNLF